MAFKMRKPSFKMEIGSKEKDTDTNFRADSMVAKSPLAYGASPMKQVGGGKKGKTGTASGTTSYHAKPDHESDEHQKAMKKADSIMKPKYDKLKGLEQTEYEMRLEELDNEHAALVDKLKGTEDTRGMEDDKRH